MDNELKENENSSTGVESVVKITRKEFEDGGYEETRVEQVEGGFITTVCTRKKVNGEWEYKDEKSVSTEDPNKDTSSAGVASRLESILKGLI
jgi:hypothetical protein